jgi:hypothetical protein
MRVIKAETADEFELLSEGEKALVNTPYCSCSFVGLATCVFMKDIDEHGFCNYSYSSCTHAAPPNSLCGTYRNTVVCAGLPK